MNLENVVKRYDRIVWNRKPRHKEGDEEFLKSLDSSLKFKTDWYYIYWSTPQTPKEARKKFGEFFIVLVDKGNSWISILTKKEEHFFQGHPQRVRACVGWLFNDPWEHEKKWIPSCEWKRNESFKLTRDCEFLKWKSS